MRPLQTWESSLLTRMLEYLMVLASPRNVEKIVNHLDKQRQLLSEDSIAKAVNDLKIPKIPDPTPANWQEIAWSWVQTKAPAATKTASGGLDPELAGTISFLIADRFNGRWSFENLDQCLRFVQEAIFGTQSQPQLQQVAKPVAKSARALLGEGYYLKSGHATVADKQAEAKRRAAVVKNVKDDIHNLSAHREFASKLSDANTLLEYSGGRVNWGHTNTARQKAKDALRRQFPQFASEID